MLLNFIRSDARRVVPVSCTGHVSAAHGHRRRSAIARRARRRRRGLAGSPSAHVPAASAAGGVARAGIPRQLTCWGRVGLPRATRLDRPRSRRLRLRGWARTTGWTQTRPVFCFQALSPLAFRGQRIKSSASKSSPIHMPKRLGGWLQRTRCSPVPPLSRPEAAEKKQGSCPTN